MTENTPAADSAAEIAADNLGKALLEGMIEELEKITKPWGEMREADQHMAIERLRTRVRNMVTDTMRVLFEGQYPACPAVLDSVAVRRGIRLVLKVPKGARSRHELIDHEGQPVVVLMADPEVYLQRMNEVRASRDQRSLFETPDSMPDLSDVPDHQAGADEVAEEEPDPTNPDEADEANWVVVGNNPALERNTKTGSERRSTGALRNHLKAIIQTENMRSDRVSIAYDDAELEAAPRGKILLAIMWVDRYHEDPEVDIERPDILRLNP